MDGLTEDDTTGGIPIFEIVLVLLLIALVLLVKFSNILTRGGGRMHRQRYHYSLGGDTTNKDGLGPEERKTRRKRSRSALLDSQRNRMETEILNGLFHTQRETREAPVQRTFSLSSASTTTVAQGPIFPVCVEEAKSEERRDENELGSDLDISSSEPVSTRRRSSTPWRGLKKRSYGKFDVSPPLSPAVE